MSTTLVFIFSVKELEEITDEHIFFYLACMLPALQSTVLILNGFNVQSALKQYCLSPLTAH